MSPNPAKNWWSARPGKPSIAAWAARMPAGGVTTPKRRADPVCLQSGEGCRQHGCRDGEAGPAAGSGGRFAVLSLQRFRHRRVNETRDVTTVDGDLAYQRRGNERAVLGGGEKDVLD